MNWGGELFTDGAVAHLKIEVPTNAMDSLRSHSFRREAQREERPEVRCIVREGTNIWTDVALHLKGSLGSFRSVDDVPSFTLNFSKHVKRQRFHGLEKISLNSSVQDPTRISEKLCRELFWRGGLPVPRAGYATAEWNGRRLGVYVLLEGWNRQFIEQHFADARGPLYEGPFLTDIDRPLLVAYGRVQGSGLNLAHLLSAAREPDAAKRMARLEAVLDMERFVRLLALDLLTWNGDGYALHANNYRIFHDRRQERFVFLPHGMDQMLVLPDAPLLAGGDGIVAWAVLSLPEGRRRVLDQIRIFRNSFFQLDSIKQRAMEIATPVGLLLARETGSTNNVAHPGHHQSVVEWLNRLTERFASIDQQLAGISNLAPLRTGQALALQNASWTNRTMSGTPAFASPPDSSSLVIRTVAGATGACVTVQWLEQGQYRLEGRVRQTPATATNAATAAFRIRAPRKRSLGVDWGWDSRRRAEHLPGDVSRTLACQMLPSSVGTNWTELSCEINLLQPVADLEFLCEASGPAETQFDLPSLKLTRLSDPGRD